MDLASLGDSSVYFNSYLLAIYIFFSHFEHIYLVCFLKIELIVFIIFPPFFAKHKPPEMHTSTK